MAIISQQTEQRLTLRTVSWQSYQAIATALGDRRLRHTCDRGEFEIMSPGREPERIKHLIGRLVVELSDELDIPIQGVGSSTLNREEAERGLDPDEAYYVAQEPQVRGRDGYDPDHDPPPDLAVEIDFTSSSVPRMPVYAALGIPEVWRYYRGAVSFHVLQPDGRYADVGHSASFPLIQATDIQSFLSNRNSTDERSWVRSFAAWVRAQARR
jgi:Uma2 family endonuclease